MADEQQFIDNGLQRTQIDEFFHEELARAGYGGMDVAKTPMGTQIVLKAEKPGMVIGKGGKNIRKITSELEERFDLDDPQIDVQEVDEPDLNAQIVADRLANALERGWYFRKAGHTTIDRIMDAGALGAEIVLSGKVTGARARVEKFNRGYIKHNGEPAEEIVDKGKSVSVMKLGTIGVNVRIIPPDAELPDDFQVYEDVDVEEFVEEPEGDLEELMAEADEAIEAEDVEAEDVTGPGAGEPADDLSGEELAEEDLDAVAAEEEEIVDEEIGEEAGRAETSPPDSAERDAAEADLEEVEAAVEGADVEEEAAEEAEELIEEMEAAGADAEEQVPAETDVAEPEPEEGEEETEQAERAEAEEEQEAEADEGAGE